MARTSGDMRFEFGENWRSFAEGVSDDRIARAVDSLSTRLADFDVNGMTVLDIGCGSGLFSLAAVRLGAAAVRSFDYDGASVETARRLKSQHAAGADWAIERGDATDPTFMADLGEYDLVYAWGVLHHTGNMWRAIENTLGRVAPGGRLVLSIYNDQGPTSARWRSVKRTYNRLPARLRAAYAVVVMLPTEAQMFLSAAIRGRVGGYVREWTQPLERGMSRWHDLIDWVGGYPFEVATPDAVFRFARDRGLELLDLRTCGGGLGCNEFVFARPG